MKLYDPNSSANVFTCLIFVTSWPGAEAGNYKVVYLVCILHPHVCAYTHLLRVSS